MTWARFHSSHGIGAVHCSAATADALPASNAPRRFGQIENLAVPENFNDTTRKPVRGWAIRPLGLYVDYPVSRRHYVTMTKVCGGWGSVDGRAEPSSRSR